MSFYLLIPFAFLILAFIIKMPIGLGMMIGSIAYFLVKGIPLTTVVSTAGYGIYSSYVLIAIPLFIFTANVMNSSCVTDRIFKFANSIVGRFRGGTAYVNILASLIFAGMTGSALADASGLGLIEIDQMSKDGYDRPFSCAITAITSVIGPTFPPSIPFVIFAMISGASVGQMFIGGIIPALLLCVVLGIYVFIISKKRVYPRGKKVSGKEFLVDTFRALPALMTPVILLIGIYTGVMTPTEAGAIAGLYTIVVAFFVYRTLNLKELGKIIINTLKSTGSIFLIIAAAYCFSYIINLEQVANWLKNLMLGFSSNKYVFLLITNIVFIILGCFIDVNVTQLVFVPIFIPLAKALGINMTHFGVMLCMNMMVGLATPPFGMLLFITAGIGKCSMKRIIREILPMLGFVFAALIIITYVPQTVLWLPSMMAR
ncbi:MAG: TRAP transporter large permease [Spirochaetales bacterium]|nr:TRAP transporter large permease [Spirochaetales bacterium]